MITTPETIAELRKLMAEATPGPWASEITNADNAFLFRADTKGSLGGVMNNLGMLYEPQNAKMIASAVNALPGLLSDLEASQKREQKLLRLLHNCTLDPGKNAGFWKEVSRFILNATKD